MPALNLNSMRGGELSPKILGRTDLPQLAHGCRRLRNFLPSVVGGAYRRPGTLYSWETYYGAESGSCLIPFVFSTDDALILELSDRILRFAANGALVLDGFSHPVERNAPWVTADLFAIQYVQVNDIMWLSHGSWCPRQLTRRSGNDNWGFQSIHDIIEAGLPEFGGAWPAMLDENLTASTLSCAATTGAGILLTASTEIFVAEHATNGGAFFEIAHRRETSSDEVIIPVYPAAFNTLSITGQPTAGQQFSIDGRYYTIVAVGDAISPNLIALGPDAEGTRDNIIKGINATTGSVVYGPGTAPHPTVTAADGGNVSGATPATATLTGDGNPNLSSGSNVRVRIDFSNFAHEYKFDNNPANPYEVKIMPTQEGSLKNLVAAINLTGVGNGSDYKLTDGTTTMVAHTSVSAAMTGANQITITALTGGTPGNSITLSVNFGVSTRLIASGPTLAGGAASGTWKVKVSARTAGEEGNAITVTETLSNATWATATLTGGRYVSPVSDGIKILGDYKIWSTGLWSGLVMLEQQNAAFDPLDPENLLGWDVLRQWNGRNDRTITETGTSLDPDRPLRFRVVNGTAQASSGFDVGRFIIEANDSTIYGLVRVKEFLSATMVSVDVCRDLYSTDGTTRWSEGAWSDYRGYPRGTTIHNQRLCFFGTTHQPQTLWCSATDDFLAFRRGVNDADSITITIAANESSPIVWGRSLGAGMVIGKESGEWLVTSDDGEASITPTNIKAKFQSSYGSEDRMALPVGPRLLFIQNGGRGLLEFQFQYDSQEFFAVDLAEVADHLVRGRIQGMTYQRKPDSVIWAWTRDGKLLSLTYRRDREMLAWAYHPMSNATVESACSIPGSNGLDELYLIVTRTIGGIERRYVERLDVNTPLQIEDEDIDDAAERALLTFLDCSLHVDNGSTTTSFSGFGHLEGQSIAVMLDGTIHEPCLVQNGTISTTRSGRYVTGGIDYAADSLLVPSNFDLQTPTGTATDKTWQVKNLTLRLYRSETGQYTTDFENAHWRNLKTRKATHPVNAPIPLLTGIHGDIGMDGGFYDDIKVGIRPVGGTPLSVLALIPRFEINT